MDIARHWRSQEWMRTLTVRPGGNAPTHILRFVETELANTEPVNDIAVTAETVKPSIEDPLPAAKKVEPKQPTIHTNFGFSPAEP